MTNENSAAAVVEQIAHPVLDEKYESLWFHGYWVPVSKDEENDLLIVNIYDYKNRFIYQEDWNLTYTRVGFDQGDYFVLNSRPGKGGCRAG
jgi:hypothetical protein